MKNNESVTNNSNNNVKLDRL